MRMVRINYYYNQFFFYVQIRKKKILHMLIQTYLQDSKGAQYLKQNKYLFR